MANAPATDAMFLLPRRWTCPYGRKCTDLGFLFFRNYRVDEGKRERFIQSFIASELHYAEHKCSPLASARHPGVTARDALSLFTILHRGYRSDDQFRKIDS